MSKYIEIVVIVEGKTEEIFIKDILAPYLAQKNIFMTPIIISKPGQKGGDVRFVRAINDIKLHMQKGKHILSDKDCVIPATEYENSLITLCKKQNGHFHAPLTHC